MKHKISIALAATSVAAMLAFTSCKKDVAFNAVNEDGGNSNSQVYTERTAALTSPIDRLDAIVKDLSVESYSFSFSKTFPTAGITRTAYGADNYLVFADPQDVICPDPIRLKYKRIPIWKRPNFIVPTCPDMIIDITKLKQVQDILVKADPSQYSALRGLRISNGGTLLTTDKFTKTYASLQLDKLDAMTKDLNPERFIMMGAPDNINGGAFTRGFYGYADLNSLVFKPYRTNLKDFIKPTLKGCFDPLILKVIRERLIQYNAGMYQGLTVTPLAENKSIAVLN